MPTRPRSVANAIQVIWITIAIDAMMMVSRYVETDTNVNALVFNGIMLLFYSLMTVRISAGRSWARRAYAFLVAMELALIAAYGLSDASDLEVLVTYLTLPLELWILVQLFRAEADAWFKARERDRLS